MRVSRESNVPFDAVPQESDAPSGAPEGAGQPEGAGHRSIATAARGRVARLSRHARRFMLVSATLLIASCSSLKLGYNNADWLLVYSIDSYLDLDERQEEFLRERARELVAWHRSTQLRGYAELLDSAATRVRGSVAADDVLALQSQITERLAIVAAQAAPDLADLAATLTPAQLDHLQDRLARDMSKARLEAVRFANPESDERLRRFVDRAETWFGTLKPDQVELVRRMLAERPIDASFWMAERERRQRATVDVLRRIQAERPSRDTAAAWLRNYFVDLVQPADPSWRERLEAMRRVNAEVVAALINGATAEQRTLVQKKLRGYAEDLGTLALARQR